MRASSPLSHSFLRLPFVLFLALVFTIPAPGFAGIPVPGQPAPDVTLPGLLDTAVHSLKDLKGKVVLMNIWASWCTSCKEEMEDLMAVHEQYGARGFSLVTVNIDNAPAAAVEFMGRLEARTKKKPAGILLYDRDKLVPKAYLQRAVPTSYLIDREGRLRKIYLGSFSKSTLTALKADIEEALK